MVRPMTRTVSTPTKVCLMCDTPLHISQTGAYRELDRGYVEIRSQGGSNAVSFPRYTGRYLCGPCHDLKVSGDQLELFT